MSTSPFGTPAPPAPPVDEAAETAEPGGQGLRDRRRLAVVAGAGLVAAAVVAAVAFLLVGTDADDGMAPSAVPPVQQVTPPDDLAPTTPPADAPVQAVSGRNPFVPLVSAPSNGGAGAVVVDPGAEAVADLTGGTVVPSGATGGSFTGIDKITPLSRMPAPVPTAPSPSTGTAPPPSRAPAPAPAPSVDPAPAALNAAESCAAAEAALAAVRDALDPTRPYSSKSAGHSIGQPVVALREVAGITEVQALRQPLSTVADDAAALRSELIGGASRDTLDHAAFTASSEAVTSRCDVLLDPLATP